jgi:hypothetical protein
MRKVGNGSTGSAGSAASGTEKYGDAPALTDLMPWSVAPLRLGRNWVLAPDAATLTARWEQLVQAGSEAEREALFHPTKARTLHSAVAQLPGHPAPTTRLALESGRCPEPVRVLHGAFDQQWLIPDHRLIDTARPELWRVADGQQQIFAVEQARIQQSPGPPLVFSALLPDGHAPAGRPGRIRPLFRRPGGLDPNLAPGLREHLADRLGLPVAPGDILAWTAVAARHSPAGRDVPLTADPGLWAEGVALGHHTLQLHTRAGNPRLPGGRRPYVRAVIPDAPAGLGYDPEEEALHLGTGRIAPVPAAVWEFHAGGTRVLETWFERRAASRSWPRTWTSELLELITVLALLAETRPQRRRIIRRLAEGPRIDAAGLRAAGVLPVPEGARQPASVLDHREEGPGGQFALL